MNNYNIVTDNEVGYLYLNIFQAPTVEVDKYVNHTLPTKESIHPRMDDFSFMPRIELVQQDSVQV